MQLLSVSGVLLCLTALVAAAERPEPVVAPRPAGCGCTTAVAPEQLLPMPDPIGTPGTPVEARGPADQCKDDSGNMVPANCGLGPIYSCPQCDSNDDGNPDKCENLCDNDGDGKPDTCYQCNSDSTANPHADVCFLCDTTGNGVNDTCKTLCDPDGDAKFDKCFQYDTDGDGKKDSCCAEFRIELVLDDDFAGRNRARVGVGETGSVKITVKKGADTPDLEWNLLGNATGTAQSWTAGDRYGSFTICAKDKKGGCTTCMSVFVVEPSRVVIEREPGTGILHLKGYASCGFKGRPYLTPADVSFFSVQVREQEAEADAKLYFKYQDGQRHPLGSWVGISEVIPGKGSKVGGVDTINGSSDNHTPYEFGTYLWPIPWEFRVGGGAEKEFTTVNHYKTIDAAGTVTITKGGHSETCGLNDSSSNY